MTSANSRHGAKSATMTPETRVPPLLVKRDSQSGRIMRNGKNIDVGGIKPLVTRTEIQCGRLSNVRTTGGKPSYKSQEEQYQEIQELRRSLGDLREENSSLKTRSRRLEEDLIRRDRQIEQLMDPAKNDEARRKLTDKGASLVSSLKLRVSRLEATLKDKEAELGKLQASCKATSLNELKIEAETYYQEVVRLRNQLNIVQQQQQQQQEQYQQHQESPHQSLPQHQPSQQHLQLPSNQQNSKPVNSTQGSSMPGGRDSRDGMHGRRDGGDGQEAPATSLRHALTQLEEENARLGQQLSSVAAEKDKLSADLERVLGVSEEVKSNYEGLSKAELIRELERRHEEVSRWETQHSHLTEALARRNDLDEESSVLLQARVAELQGREAEWERERSSLRELINTLKDDRMFYMETAHKKDSELDSLRSEIQGLQQEVISLHNVQRRRKERPAGTVSPRPARGSTKPSLLNASGSGSSSETNPPSRRIRPSSARPPAPGTRPQRASKSSSEPREMPTPNKTRRTPIQNSPKKPTVTKSSPKTSSSVSSTPKGPTGSMQNSKSTTRPSSGSRRPTVSSSTSSPKASPYGSPKHSSVGRAPSTSASPKSQTPTSSPQKLTNSMSPQRKPTGVSPQHRVTGSASPQHRSVYPSSPTKASTSRSSSRTSTPSLSSVKSSPYKANSPKKSPSKVPQPKVGVSPSKSGKKQEENASPARTLKSPHKQQTIQEASAEEDERVLAEILFRHETDSSIETSDIPSLARQRTMTLSVHEDMSPANSEGENAALEHPNDGTSLLRQNTVTLSKTEDDDEAVTGSGQREAKQATITRGEEETSLQEKNDSERIRKSIDLTGSGVCAQESKITGNLELLQSLLSSHLFRQQEVSELLSREPLLVGEGQSQSDSESQDTPRGRGRSTREEPDGEESAKATSKRSQSLVRQGTFNVYDQDTTVTTIHATLDAHWTRVNKVQQFSSK